MTRDRIKIPNKLTITDLERPACDLISWPWVIFGPILRTGQLPTATQLESLDQIIRLRVVLVLTTCAQDLDKLREEEGGLRRFVPHNKRAELDTIGSQPWAARWNGYADLISAAISFEMARRRRP